MCVVCNVYAIRDVSYGRCVRCVTFILLVPDGLWSVASVKNFCVFLMLFVDATLCFSAFDVACCSVLLLFFVVRTFK